MKKTELLKMLEAIPDDGDIVISSMDGDIHPRFEIVPTKISDRVIFGWEPKGAPVKYPVFHIKP